MPLPKPPTKRADMLTDVDFASQPKAAKTASPPAGSAASKASRAGSTRRSPAAETPVVAQAVANPPVTTVAAPATEAPRP